MGKLSWLILFELLGKLILALSSLIILVNKFWFSLLFSGISLFSLFSGMNSATFFSSFFTISPLLFWFFSLFSFSWLALALIIISSFVSLTFSFSFLEEEESSKFCKFFFSLLKFIDSFTVLFLFLLKLVVFPSKLPLIFIGLQSLLATLLILSSSPKSTIFSSMVLFKFATNVFNPSFDFSFFVFNFISSISSLLKLLLSTILIFEFIVFIVIVQVWIDFCPESLSELVFLSFFNFVSIFLYNLLWGLSLLVAGFIGFFKLGKSAVLIQLKINKSLVSCIFLIIELNKFLK